VPSTPSETPINEHDPSKDEPVVTTTANDDGSTPIPEQPNLDGSHLIFFF
jgi:hypothetical protein